MAKKVYQDISIPENNDEVMERSLKQAEAIKKEELPLDEMPLDTLRDYRLYNEAACKMNKKLRSNRYPLKQCPTELHPKQRVKFGNNDQSVHPVKVMVSDHRIHFDESLTPGKIYDLPECIVHYLSEKGYPVWGWVTLPDGSKETRKINTKPRFSLTTVYQGSY